ncbi:unnamed protein product [Pedinophyceae sp. YPF-701]|nr:unnamed protein product [Pedinophyceae sp. YPF-701]
MSLARAAARAARGALAADLWGRNSQAGLRCAQTALAADTLNERVLKAKYAVRGEIVTLANKIQKDLDEGNGSYPFDKVLYCNIGNPHQLGQQPITFYRQVLTIMESPDMADWPGVRDQVPSDVIARARRYLAGMRGMGAYTDSRGALVLRESVARGIAERDGYDADPDDIFMTDGATAGVHMAMRLLLRDRSDSFLVPIPQYPLYSACIELYNGTLAPYYLNETGGWRMDARGLAEAVKTAREKGSNPRAIVVINPGNPTGNVLSYEDQRAIVDFCARENLVLMADEVYQANIYSPDARWQSFKKVLRDMEADGSLGQGTPESPASPAMMSMMSTSKGFYGECGRRGGYVEVVGVSPEIKAEMYKLQSISLCANTSGQVVMACVMDPPRPGEPSHAVYERERSAILGSLARRANMVADGLNKLEGVSCQVVEGALYAFPTITLPPRAVEEAKKAGKTPEGFYCIELLKNTGVVAVPGDGFGQQEGTAHLRTTILPDERDIATVLESMTAFHKAFMDKWR